MARERFHTELRVRFSETDLQGHVFFGNYLDYFDVALVEYTKALGFSYQRMVEAGVDLVFVEAVSRFHGSARFDDLLRVACWIGRLGNTSLRFDFGVSVEGRGGRVASGSITGVCLDHTTREPIPVPGELRRAVLAYQGEVPGGEQPAPDGEESPL